MKYNDLKKLFDSQIERLRPYCSSQIIQMLMVGMEKVLNHAETLTIGEGHLVFAPVLTPLYLGYQGIVALVRNGSKSGYTYLDPTRIEDVEKVPLKLYYQFDVEDGTKRLGVKPEVSEKEIQAEKRLRSTTAEIVSIAIHTAVLSKHNMDAVGSRYGSVNAPFLCLNVGEPRLSWGNLGSANGHWGAPSCSSRLEL